MLPAANAQGESERGTPIVVEELCSVLVVATLKLVLGKVVERFYLGRSNVVLLLQQVEIIGFVLLE